MEDLIWKKDALEVASKECREWRGIFERIEMALKNIPAVEPKQGTWLFKEITDDYHVTGQCSVCKERRRIDNFCPNCGADMQKGADNERP